MIPDGIQEHLNFIHSFALLPCRATQQLLDQVLQLWSWRSLDPLRQRLAINCQGGRTFRQPIAISAPSLAWRQPARALQLYR